MPTRGVCHQRTVGPLAGTYPTSQAASRWAGGWYPLWPLSTTVPFIACALDECELYATRREPLTTAIAEWGTAMQGLSALGAGRAALGN